MELLGAGNLLYSEALRPWAIVAFKFQGRRRIQSNPESDARREKQVTCPSKSFDFNFGGDRRVEAPSISENSEAENF